MVCFPQLEGIRLTRSWPSSLFSPFPFFSFFPHIPSPSATTVNAFIVVPRLPSRHTLLGWESPTFLFPWVSLWFSTSPRCQPRRLARPRGVFYHPSPPL